VAEEGVAPHLAVGDDVEAAGFLQRNRLIDGASSIRLNSAAVMSPRSRLSRASFR
jgi:hypothetical protein